MVYVLTFNPYFRPVLVQFAALLSCHYCNSVLAVCLCLTLQVNDDHDDDDDDDDENLDADQVGVMEFGLNLSLIKVIICPIAVA